MNKFIIDNHNSLISENDKWVLYTNGVIQNEQPEYLYKYYSLNSYNLDSLKNGYFHLNNPKNFNDPFDCCNNLIIEKQQDSIDGLPSPLINDIKDLGISCLSSNGLNPLMWGHYTNCYFGFVVKFKKELELVNNSDFLSNKLVRVIYSDNPNPASEKFVFAEDYQSMIKLKHWEYENEWRLIVKKKDISLNQIFYSKKCVDEIMVGFNVFNSFNSPSAKEQHDNLMKIINEDFPGIKIYRVGPHEKEFRLTKLELRQGTIDDFPNIRINLIIE